MKPWDDREEFRSESIDNSMEETEPGHEQPRENPFGRDFERHEAGRLVERRHEDAYTGPYDRWRPRDYVFYSGAGYHREFIEPYKEPSEGTGRGRYVGRGPRGYRRSDARIEEEVNEALTVSPYLDATEIRVSVSEGEVSLEGTVRDRRSKRLAEDLAAGLRGVLDVQNRLRIAAPAAQSGAEGFSGGAPGTAAGRPRARS
ncbi:MAG TPA: BON domain-containing protein [Thermoanaerobaculia bacterium]|nr:BON domain-containing protein [Thermoanaerobaculia bacterium]